MKPRAGPVLSVLLIAASGLTVLSRLRARRHEARRFPCAGVTPRPVPVVAPRTPRAAATASAPRTASAIRRLPRLLASLPVCLATGVAAGLIASVVAPLAIGAHPLTVMSGSMHPAINTGDVVVVRPIPATHARVGDVVTFRDPKRHHKLITHRVRGLSVHGRRVSVVTRGDANNTAERWSVPAAGTVGRVVYRLPKAGYLSRLAAGPGGRVALIVIPALLLGAWALLAIWRPRPAPGPAPAVAGAAR